MFLEFLFSDRGLFTNSTKQSTTWIKVTDLTTIKLSGLVSFPLNFTSYLFEATLNTLGHRTQLAIGPHLFQ